MSLDIHTTLVIRGGLWQSTSQNRRTVLVHLGAKPRHIWRKSLLTMSIGLALFSDCLSASSTGLNSTSLRVKSQCRGCLFKASRASVELRVRAISRGVCPSEFLASRLAPRSRRNSMASVLLPRTAVCNGVPWPQCLPGGLRQCSISLMSIPRSSR